MGKEPLLQLENLKVDFFLRSGKATAIHGLDLQLERGKTLGLVGESGCGKSLTALAIMGLISSPGKITSGEIRFDGEDLLKISERKRRELRGNQISMIFQDPSSALNPVLTIGKQISEPLRRHKGFSAQQARDQGLSLLSEVGLPDPERQWSRYPHELSGGMCQRVMIAMALACEPALLIADEPTTALDVTIQVQILHLLRQLQKQHGMALLFISHDLRVIAEMADRVAIMYAGDIIEETSVRAIFERPRHPYTRGLLKSRPSLTEISGQRERLYHIPGNVPSLQELSEGCRFLDRCPLARTRLFRQDT